MLSSRRLSYCQPSRLSEDVADHLKYLVGPRAAARTVEVGQAGLGLTPAVRQGAVPAPDEQGGLHERSPRVWTHGRVEHRNRDEVGLGRYRNVECHRGREHRVGEHGEWQVEIFSKALEAYRGVGGDAEDSDVECSKLACDLPEFPPGTHAVGSPDSAKREERGDRGLRDLVVQLYQAALLVEEGKADHVRDCSPRERAKSTNDVGISAQGPVGRDPMNGPSCGLSFNLQVGVRLIPSRVP